LVPFLVFLLYLSIFIFFTYLLFLISDLLNLVKAKFYWGLATED
jgi:hypothetical protein